MRLTRGPRRTIKAPSDGPRTPEEARIQATFRAFKAGITGAKGEASVREVLATLGTPALHDVIVRDQRGLTQIDHLVRTPDAIVVLETKRYGGIINGELDGRTWTQRFPDSSEQFELPNAVRQNYRHLMAVEAAIGNSSVSVRSFVVAAGSAIFEGELRTVLVPAAGLGRVLSGSHLPSQRWLNGAWDKLQAMAARNASLREAHRREIEARRS